MVLVHGGTDRGAELIVAHWADTRKVVHIAFKPNWDRDRKAGPSSATTECSKCCRWVSTPSQAPASPSMRKAKELGIGIVDRRAQPACKTV
jgi:hypothetical protein